MPLSECVMRMTLLILLTLWYPITGAFAEQPRQSEESRIMEDPFKKVYEAAESGDIDELRLLLKSNPSLVKSTDQYGSTPLHGAAGEEDTQVVDLLLTNGADINAKNNDGVSPIHVAVYPRMAAYLITKGADINLPSSNGDTPLHTFAAEAEGLDVMEVLLKAGANPNLRNRQGQLPIDIATSRKEGDKASLLKKYSK